MSNMHVRNKRHRYQLKEPPTYHIIDMWKAPSSLEENKYIFLNTIAKFDAR